MLSRSQKLAFRSSIKSLGDWATYLETCLIRKKTPLLSPQLKETLWQLSGTTDPEAQFIALTDIKEQQEAEYLSLLEAEAPDKLASYIEYMTPDEPPPEHVELLCDIFEKMERREIMRATFSVPTGYAKSKTLSRMAPSWYLGRHPFHKWLQGGHSQNFVETEFGSQTRDLLFDPKYRRVFPNVEIHPRSTAAGNWKLLNGRGGYVCKGVGQKIAGYRGHFGMTDDLIGSREDADSETIRDKTWAWLWADYRLRFLPDSPIGIIATRWHPDDPIGRIEEMNKKGIGLPWTIINLNVIIETEEEMAHDPLGRGIGEVLWPDYYTLESVLELKATLPSRDWWAIQKGRPRNVEGNLVKIGWWGRYDTLPRDQTINGVLDRQVRRITLSVDTATKKQTRNNPTCLGVWIEDIRGRHYLAHVEKKKVELPELQEFIETTAVQWKATTILVEDKGNGTAYIQLRQGKAPAPIIAIPPETEGSKWNRFDRCADVIQAGEVILPKRAVWLDDYENELLSFPNCTNDDQVDMTSQYLNWARKRRRFGTKKLAGTARAA
jgi:predicted phage terminase large subunit-like protein